MMIFSNDQLIISSSRGHCFFWSAPAERSGDGALDVRRNFGFR